MRPKTLDEFVGQQHLVGPSSPIRRFMESGQLPSMIFWGPPGTGKTTLAYIISQSLLYDFYKMQAVSSGKAKLMSIIKIARQNQDYNKKTVLFLDEIHRWNKAQQDTLLPYVEKGIITLIGATTENPSFTINNALLSRTKVFLFHPHTAEDIELLLKRAAKELKIKIRKPLIESIADSADGDIRNAYNTLEMAEMLARQESPSSIKGTENKQPEITKELLAAAVQKQLMHDRDGEEHYNIISAIHKSMRSSDPDAAVYWITRMLVAGDDPLYIARRLLRFASEDIGNADPQALILANSVFEACQKLGMPECAVHLTQLGIYLANAPKDNSAYVASQLATEDVRVHGNLPVPLHIRNAPTKLMKQLGYSKGYVYDHDVKGKKSGQQCLPDKLVGRKYVKPN
ncbi:MAG: replication-associated recombination protein A [Candidatus Dojkabacteria bacterium]|nr:MAG: replication-associated recombination protein A [Candidatus Dojkabacteria bacterium]